jgi:16S rRNA processing protein RimM
MDDLVVIAKIRKPHGVKGEVQAEPLTFDISRFAKLGEVTLRKGNEIRSVVLEGYRPIALGILLKFRGIDDRNAAELLRNFEVCIPSAERLPLPDSEAYFDEIVGMNAVDADSGEKIGVVSEVYSYPAGVAYDIRLDDGSIRTVSTSGGEVVSLSRSGRVVRLRLLEED